MTSEEIVARIQAMEVRGGSAIGRAAIEALALIASEYDGVHSAELRQRVEQAGERLIRIKPSMATVANAVRGVTQVLARQAGDRMTVTTMKAALAAWAQEAIRRSEESLSRLAAVGANLLEDGMTVLTHSYSDSVLHVIQAAAQSKSMRVIATESRPLCEGRRFVEAAAWPGVTCVVIADAAMASAVERADVVIVGADAIAVTGAFVNKTGTLALALAAAHAGVPLYVAAETAKVDPRSARGVPPQLEERPSSELTDGWAVPSHVTVWNRFFEITPGRFVEAYVTERGLIAPAAVAAILASEPGDEMEAST